MRGSRSHLGRVLPAAFAAAVLSWPAAAGAWGPPRAGGFGPDVLHGGPGADFLRGAEGHDRISGRGGADLLTGDTGPDTIAGGAGNDTLIGGSGIDLLAGGAGDDISSGGFGADVLDGGAGGDALDGGQDADRIAAGAGDDLVHGGSGIDRIDGGPGNDRLFADSGGDFIAGGDGDDVIVVDGAAFAHVTCGSGRDTVYLTVPASVTTDYAGPGTAGTRAADCEVVELTDAVQDPNRGVTFLAPNGGSTRDGTALDDVLLGGPGTDTLRGRDGNDVLWGLRQAGLTSVLPDVIDAGPGDDTVYGGPGPQRISGGSGDDFIEGGIGDNVIKAGAGDDTIRLRGTGASSVRAGAGADTIFARGPARATIACGAGRDVVHADRGDVAARDCERVIGSGVKRTARTAAAAPARAALARRASAARARAAGTRRAPLRAAAAAPRRVSVRAAAAGPRRASLRAAGAAYADLVAATPGLEHWWRMTASPAQTPFLGMPYGVMTDRVTGTAGGAFQVAPDPGPTDDGDGAYDTGSAAGYLYPGTPDDALRSDAFTFEGWFRPGDSGFARALLTDTSYAIDATTYSGTALVLEADGSLHATIIGVSDAPRVELRSAPLGLGTRWHHVALTRTPDAIMLYVDGAVVAQGPATVVPRPSPDSNWFVGRDFGTTRAWLGGIDEIATYDRALDAATVRAHARAGEDGVPPVTRTVPAFGPLQPGTTRAQFVTDKGGSTFECGLDAAPLVPCPSAFVMVDLAQGPHELHVRATDRFGVAEVTPALVRFTVDTALPHTIGFVWLPADGDRRPTVVLGSDRPGTFECFPPGAVPVDTTQAPAPPVPLAFYAFTPCAAASKVARGTPFTARAIDAAGNSDPFGVALPIPRAGQGFQGPEEGLPTFAGARVEVGIAQSLGFDVRGSVFECRVDGAGWARCPSVFRLPILHEGRHTMQARARLAGGTLVTSGELVATVAPSTQNTTIVGLQASLVLVRGAALARRTPLVRFALNRAATIQVQVVRGTKRLVNVVARGSTGPNVVRLPVGALQRATTGRYALLVTARGSSGPLASQRLPLALVRPLG